MADDWEQQHGGDLAPNGHELHQDYDNLEVYLEQLMAERLQAAPPVDAWKTTLIGFPRYRTPVSGSRIPVRSAGMVEQRPCRRPA